MKRLPCAMNCDWDSGLDWKRKKESISISLMKMLNVQQKEGQDLTSYLSSVSTRQLQKESSRVSDQCWTLDSTCVSSSVRLSVCLSAAVCLHPGALGHNSHLPARLFTHHGTQEESGGLQNATPASIHVRRVSNVVDFHFTEKLSPPETCQNPFEAPFFMASVCFFIVCVGCGRNHTEVPPHPSRRSRPLTGQRWWNEHGGGGEE